MSFKNIFASPSIDVSEEMEGNDIKYLESLPHRMRDQIPSIIIKNIAYQLVLDKYLQLFEICWKYNDEVGNNQRFADCLNYPDGTFKELDSLQYYLINLPLDTPKEEIIKEFCQKIYNGELEFACRMHVIDGYTAYDFALGYLNHYKKGDKLEFSKRYDIKKMIFLPSHK